MKATTQYSVFWRLRFTYYQYNDGSGNNGHFRDAIIFTDKEEAVRARDAIQKAIEANKAHVGMADSDPNLPDYIPGCCGGYYTWAELFRVDEAESPLGLRVSNDAST